MNMDPGLVWEWGKDVRGYCNEVAGSKQFSSSFSKVFYLFTDTLHFIFDLHLLCYRRITSQKAYFVRWKWVNFNCMDKSDIFIVVVVTATVDAVQ